MRDSEITHYENFLKVIGFKRSDGAIFGLLAFSADPLSSEEIGEKLGLSQGAVSQGLKNLSHWGAVESRYSPERRVQLHRAVPDSISIAATVFQKREKGAIEAFRRANEEARDRFLAAGADPGSERIRRLESYITTCELAQLIMDFVIKMSQLGVTQSHYSKVIRAMPRVLGTLIEGTKTLSSVKNRVLSQVKERTKWL